mgnify:CR=1 FL=1
MKFFELDLSNGRKVCRKTWTPETLYWYVENGIIKNDSNNIESIYINNVEDDWGYFIEPVEKKKIMLYAYADKDLIKDELLYELNYSISDKIANEYCVRLPELDKEVEV